MAKTVRTKKPSVKTSIKPKTKAPVKTSLLGTFFQKSYGKPTAFVVAFAIIGIATVWWASAATTTYSLWSNSTVPKTITANDPKSVELGVKFQSKVAGYISGIKFYKGAQNTGTHIGNLWDTKGDLLAQVTFTNETSSGWQTANFSKPVSIAANVTYIASYFAPNGHYSANNFYFQGKSVNTKNLVAPASTRSSSNGVYTYSNRTTFPSSTYQSTNYWVDVLFSSKLVSPQPAPAAPTNLAATLTSTGSQVALSWKASTAANPISNYVVYRNSSKIATVTNGTNYTDANVTAGNTYSYQVLATDSTGAASPLSTAVSIKVTGSTTSPTPPPVTSPNPPTNPTPPPITGVPISGSFPSASNTGATGTLTAASGDVILGNANQVYQNIKLNGTLAVTACNVTIKNVEIDTGESYKGDATDDLHAIWLQEPENCSVTLDHVTVNNTGAYMTDAIRDAYGGPLNMTNSKFIGMQIGIVGLGAGTLTGNYMQLAPNLRGDHNEDVEIYGGDNLTMTDNTMLNDNDQTAVIACFTDFGSNKNMLFSDNLMAGGGYTVYGCGGLTDDQGKASPASNIDFINNVFWKKYYPNVGNYGEGRDYSAAGGGQWTGNVYMNADGTLTTTAVPQPPVATN